MRELITAAGEVFLFCATDATCFAVSSGRPGRCVRSGRSRRTPSPSTNLCNRWPFLLTGTGRAATASLHWLRQCRHTPGCCYSSIAFCVQRVCV